MTETEEEEEEEEEDSRSQLENGVGGTFRVGKYSVADKKPEVYRLHQHFNNCMFMRIPVTE